MQEAIKKQASQVSWMKSRLKDSQFEDQNAFGVIRKWDFIKRKVNLMLKKVQNICGQFDMNQKIVGLRIWLDEAEYFLKYHSKENRNTQEILKIKVNFSNLPCAWTTIKCFISIHFIVTFIIFIRFICMYLFVFIPCLLHQQAFFSDLSTQEKALKSIQDQLEDSQSSVQFQELLNMQERVLRVKEEVGLELLKLKFNIYEKRANHLLDTAERKLKNGRERFADGDDGKHIMNKLKVCSIQSSINDLQL